MGTRSEGEEEEVLEKKKATLGRTPNHLSLSTTSTLSTGSTGSMAKLIQASNQPAQYQPARSVESNQPETIPTNTTLVTPIKINVHGGFEHRNGGFPTHTQEPRHRDVGITTHNSCYIVTEGRTEIHNSIIYNHQNGFAGVPHPRQPPYISNGHTKQTVTRTVQTTVRPASMNGGPFHSLHTGSPMMGAVATGRTQRQQGGTVKSSPWPGFPYTEEGTTQIAHDMDDILQGGMTIDSLLQQLRALS